MMVRASLDLLTEGLDTAAELPWVLMGSVDSSAET